MDVAVHEEAWPQALDQAVERAEAPVCEIVFLGPESLGRRVRQQDIEAAAAQPTAQAGEHLDAQRPPAHLGLRGLVWAWAVPHRNTPARDGETRSLLGRAGD